MNLILWALATSSVLANSAHHQSIPKNFSTDVTSIGHPVLDLEKTLQFYNGVLGLEILSQDHSPREDPAYSVLTNTEHATYKTALLQIPNQNWTLKNSLTAPALTLSVKNATAINTVLRAANVTTLNGQTIPVGTGAGTTSTVFIYDPDGYILECDQCSGPSDYFSVPPPTDLDSRLDILGLNISAGFEPLIGPGYAPLGPIGGIFGIPTNVSWAAATGNCDADTRCEFYEYDDPDRVAIVRPVQDVGIGWTSYVVGDLDGILEAVRKNKQVIVTPGGKPVEIDGTNSVMIRDPSGYLIRLDQAK